MRINNIYIISIVIIIISFILPVTMLKKDENSFGLIVYKEIPKRGVTADIKNIYLVKAIHDIEKATEKVLIDPKTKYYADFPKNDINIEKEIRALENYGIIENILEEKDNYNMEIEPKYLIKNGIEYTINEANIILDKTEYSFEIEEKSGKILSMYIDKKILNSKSPKEEILMKYIKYLGLEVIDDWKYEAGLLSSEKADIIVSSVENELENKCMISLHSGGILKNKN